MLTILTLVSSVSQVVTAAAADGGSIAVNPDKGAGDPLKIENEQYRLLINPVNGAILGVFDKPGNMELIADSRLADSFRLCLPIPATLTDPGTQANYIRGREQKLTSIEHLPNGAILNWGSPLKNEHGKSYDISVTMRIELTPSGVQWFLDVKNRTDLKLMEVWYPILGGIQGLGERRQTLAHIPSNGGEANPDIFWNTRVPYNLGTPVPEYLFSCPGEMPESWMCIYNKSANRAMYYGMHDAADRQKVLRIEMQPGVGVLRQGDSWPRPDELGKETPLGLILCWLYYLPADKMAPGGDFHGAPVILQFHNGDWHESAEVFKEWKDSSD